MMMMIIISTIIINMIIMIIIMKIRCVVRRVGEVEVRCKARRGWTGEHAARFLFPDDDDNFHDGDDYDDDDYGDDDDDDDDDYEADLFCSQQRMVLLEMDWFEGAGPTAVIRSRL